MEIRKHCSSLFADGAVLVRSHRQVHWCSGLRLQLGGGSHDNLTTTDVQSQFIQIQHVFSSKVH